MSSNSVKDPLVSIVMNCHNSSKYLKEAIDSIYLQSYARWEIIFWDNASTDDSAKIAKSYDSKLRYFYGDSLVSLYEARNLAVAQCEGNYIAFLDCDDIWVADKLKWQISEVNRGAKIVYGNFNIIDGNGKLVSNRNQKNPSGKITNQLLTRNSISIGSILLETDVLKSNLFDPYYDLLGDFELWIRLSLQYEIVSMNEVVELSRAHDGNLSNSFRDKWATERRRFYIKFISGNSILKYYGIIRYAAMTEVKSLYRAR